MCVYEVYSWHLGLNQYIIYFQFANSCDNVVIKTLLCVVELILTFTNTYQCSLIKIKLKKKKVNLLKMNYSKMTIRKNKMYQLNIPEPNVIRNTCLWNLSSQFNVLCVYVCTFMVHHTLKVQTYTHKILNYKI